MTKNFHINTKIRILGLITLLTFSAMACIGIYGVTQSKDFTSTIVDRAMPAFEKLIELHDCDSAIRYSQKTLLIPSLEKAERVPNEIQIINEETKRFDTLVSELDIIYGTDLSLSPEERQYWADFKEYWEGLKEHYQSYLNRITSYHSTGNEEIYKGAFEHNRDVLEPTYIETHNRILELIKTSRTGIIIDATHAKDSALGIRAFLILSFFIGILILIVICMFAVKNIRNPIIRTITALNQLAQQLAGTSAEVSAGGQQLAEGNAEIASSIEETASTVDEFTSIINQNNNNTQSAVVISQKTSAAAKDGIGEMGSMQSIMNEIKKSSDQMAKIINIIDEVSFQTNILAINAAIEAAHAGDAGRSFAVVADEIRNLSQRSAQAAKETSDIIKNNIELSESGVDETGKIAKCLEQIADNAVSLNELIDEIEASSSEQAHGITSISGAMEQMEKVTQANAANAEGSATAAAGLTAQAQILKRTSDDLYAMISGKKTVVNSVGKMPKSINETAEKADIINRKFCAVASEDVIPFEKDNGGF